MSGKLPKESHKVIPLQEAKKYLKFEEKRLYFNKVGSRSFLDYTTSRGSATSTTGTALTSLASAVTALRG